MLFVVHDIRAERVNLLMNDFTAGLPSPLAFLGLAAAVAPALSAPRWSIAVLPVLHEVNVSEGRTKAEMIPKGKAGEKAFKPAEIAEDLIGTVRVSLLLDVPECSSAHAVADALLGRRLAGGPIINESLKVEAVTADGSALSRCRRGYALTRPQSASLDIVAGGRIDELQRFAATLYSRDGADREGLLVPVAVGHRLLENPTSAPKRRHTRDPDIPHVFAEPLVGIAELVSVRNPKLTGLDEAGRSDLMWRWVAEGDWIVGHPCYHPHHRREDPSGNGSAEQEQING